MKAKTLIQAIASEVTRYYNIAKMGGDTSKVQACLDQLEGMLPSGSGIDCGTGIVVDNSTATKIVLYVEYHHMNEHGMYCGWSGHKLIVAPAFDGIDIDLEQDYDNSNITYTDDDGEEVRESANECGQLYDYLADTYYHALSQLVDYSFDHETKTGNYVFVTEDLRAK